LISRIDRLVLNDVITQSKLLKEERKITSSNLALVLVHDLLLSSGIQAGDGPIKQAVLRHKTRLHSEFQRIKIKRGVKSDTQLAQAGDARAGKLNRKMRLLSETGSSSYTSICAGEHELVEHPGGC
jgi:putative methyltransferase